MDRKLKNHKIVILDYIFKSIKDFLLPIIIFLSKDMSISKLLIFTGVIFLIMLLSFTKWYNTYFYIKNEKLHYNKGIISKNNIAIPIEKITTIDFSQNVLQKIVDVVTLKIDSGANNSKDSEIIIVIKKDSAEVLRNDLMIERKEKLLEDIMVEKKYDNVIINMSKKDIILYSMTQNSFAIVIGSVLSFLAFADDVLKIFNIDLDKIINKNNISFNFKFNTKIIIIIATLIVSFFVIIKLILLIIYRLKFSNFKVVKEDKLLKVEYGLLNIKKYSFPINKINAVILKQNIFRQLLGLYKVHISVIGYGDEKGEEAILVPICNKENISHILNEINPQIIFNKEMNKVNKHGKVRFFFIPMVITIIICAISIFKNKFKYVFIILIPVVFILKYLKYKNTALGYNEKIIITSFGTFTKQTVLVEMKKIQALSKKTNYFQRIKNLCTYNIQYYSQGFGGNITLKHLEDKHFKQIEKHLF
ncbi:PH domain-containing protein [Clostridium peptidivorans]|uniref:PH domain-containing protein n=1 Tax=Clostridium peptidivorans TaxID=100174 RepID=UPI000BE3C98E|nr:PH domain-containing protein [Clostridium peptidivorans]